jgi:hypothetical protein
MCARKDYDAIVLLPSDSIAGTLLTIHEADRIDANCDKPSTSRLQTTRPPIFIDSSEVKQYVTALFMAISRQFVQEYLRNRAVTVK